LLLCNKKRAPTLDRRFLLMLGIWFVFQLAVRASLYDGPAKLAASLAAATASLTLAAASKRPDSW
jgi:hypothetical protein